MKKILILFIVMYSICLVAQDILVVRIENPDAELFSYIQSKQLQITYRDRSGSIEVLIPEEIFSEMGLTLDSSRYQYRIEQTFAGIKRDLEGYHSYDEVTAELQQIAAEHPEFTSLFSLGKSTCYLYYLDGKENYVDYQHEIWCIKLSDNPLVEEDEPNVFFMGEIHARETISLEVDLYLLNYLVDKYEVEQQVTDWINSRQIWFVPLINPDGYKLVYDGDHTYHRKNMRDNDEDEFPDASSTDGVDLNRNFGYVWGPNGSSSYYTASNYHGPNAWSEIEVIYLRDLIRERKFYAGITYHSQGEYVLYPLGHLPGACSFDHLVMDDLAVEMAASTPGIYSGFYDPMQAVDFGYTCQGTMGDWAYAEQRIFGFTVELARTFSPPLSQVEEICEDNLQAALIMIDRVSNSMVSGIVTDETGTPVIADVYVVEVDEVAGMSEVEPARSDAVFGRYYRLLLPGTYTLSFELDGYDTITVENVVVTETGVTDLNITMGTLFLDNVEITSEDGMIILTWPLEEGSVEIYSALDPYDDYELESSGSFVGENSWHISASAARKFFVVKRVLP